MLKIKRLSIQALNLAKLVGEHGARYEIKSIE